MKTHRLARVSEIIREVAAETILFELRDPRVQRITVTRVETSGDLQNAKVYVSVMGSEKEQLRSVAGLQNAAGFIQSRLAKRLTTRFLPVLTFHLDDGIKKSIEIARILYEERIKNGLDVGEAELDSEATSAMDVDVDDEDDTDDVGEFDDSDDGASRAEGDDAANPAQPPPR